MTGLEIRVASRRGPTGLPLVPAQNQASGCREAKAPGHWAHAGLVTALQP